MHHFFVAVDLYNRKVPKISFTPKTNGAVRLGNFGHYELITWFQFFGGNLFYVFSS